MRNKWQNDWEKNNIKKFTLMLNKKNDDDIINWLSIQINKQVAIKELIRKEIEKTNIE